MFSQHENKNKKDNKVQAINFIPGKKNTIYKINKINIKQHKS